MEASEFFKKHGRKIDPAVADPGLWLKMNARASSLFDPLLGVRIAFVAGYAPLLAYEPPEASMLREYKLMLPNRPIPCDQGIGLLTRTAPPAATGRLHDQVEAFRSQGDQSAATAAEATFIRTLQLDPASTFGLVAMWRVQPANMQPITFTVNLNASRAELLVAYTRQRLAGRLQPQPCSLASTAPTLP